MTSYLFPPGQSALTIQGHDTLFPVRRIFCLGLNYADHTAEMNRKIGLTQTKQDLMFFSKPADAVRIDGQFPYPTMTEDCQFEVELVVALQSGGRDLDEKAAGAAIYGYAVGIDMTRRDLQTRAKEAGHPWDMAKGFDHSAPIGPISPAKTIGHPRSGKIWLKQNGTIKQSGDLAQMITSPEQAIMELSKLVELKPGDLLFTGTPSGVGPLARGDQIEAGIEGVGTLQISVI